MKSLVIHVKKVDGSMMASAKIAKYLANKLGCKILDYTDCDFVKETYDAVFWVNCPTLFAESIDLLWQSACIIIKAKRYIYVQNDYSIDVRSHSQINRLVETFGIEKPKLHVMTTVPREIETDLSSYVNWNMLTYNPIVPINPIHSELLYYGSFRKGRDEAFAKYLKSSLYPLAISAPAAARKKFKAFNSTARIVEDFKELIPQIAEYPATIYLEDSFAYKHYCSPANRFYECVAAGIAQFFDYRSRPNFEKAGIDIKPYIVTSPEELAEALPKSKVFAESQRVDFRKDFQSILSQQVDAAIKKIEDSL